MTQDSITLEVITASLGGAISAGLLYPLEVLKTRLQASNTTKDDESDRASDRSMIQLARHLHRTRGSSVFYLGAEISSLQSALEKALYFFAYTVLKRVHGVISQRSKLGTASNLLLGYLAEWAHLPITLPVDAWTTRIQTSPERNAPLKILMAMLTDKNRNLYKGLSAYVLLALKPALQYTVYEQVKATFLKTKKRNTLSSAEAFSLGMLSRTVATVLVFPFLRAKVLLQAQQQQDHTSTSMTSSTPAILVQQWKAKGVSGLYQGLGPELTRGVLSAALMLMIKERISGVLRFMAPDTSRS